MTTSAPTHWIKLYLSGPLPVIEQTCRTFCLDVGLCVTVEPTRFIYAGGEETGAVVGLINYPHFPTSPEELQLKANRLAQQLLDDSKQHSILIQNPTETVWITKRNQ